jgi:hypothetical protein
MANGLDPFARDDRFLHCIVVPAGDGAGRVDQRVMGVITKNGESTAAETIEVMKPGADVSLGGAFVVVVVKSPLTEAV